MLDKNKQVLRPGDLFKFTDGGTLIYQTFSKGDRLMFKGYSFDSNYDFDGDNLNNFKFEIIGTVKDGLDERSYDYVRKERIKHGDHFLDS